MTSLDSFKCRKTLKVGAKTYAYYSLPTAEQHGLRGISRLPAACPTSAGRSSRTTTPTGM